MQKRTKIIIAVAASLLFLCIITIAVIALFIYVNKDKDNDTQNTSTTSNSTSTSDQTYTVNNMRVENKSLDDISFNYDNFPELDGSTSTQPIRALIACHVLKIDCTWMEAADREMFIYTSPAESYESSDYSDLYQEVNTFQEQKLKNSKTHDAYLRLINKEVDLIMTSTLPSDDEINAAKEEGVKLELVPIGLDGFIFIVNPQTDISNLKTTDIVDIYTGNITNWNELGGKDIAIKPYTRQENSGSQELMNKLILKGEKQKSFPEESRLMTMAAVFDRVELTEDSIAYTLYYYKSTMIDLAEAAPNVKVISVDGVNPTADSIRDKEYPHTFNIYAVTRSDVEHDSSEYQMIEWLTSNEGQKLINQSGYIPAFEVDKPEDYKTETTPDGSIEYTVRKDIGVTKVNDTTLLFDHIINYKHESTCRANDTNGKRSTLTDVNFMMEVIDKNFVDVIKQKDELSYMEQNYNENGTNYLQKIKAGEYDGYLTYDSTEYECGRYYYVIPVSNSKTIYIEHDYIGELDYNMGIGEKNIEVEGLITRAEERRLFFNFLNSLKLK